MLLPIDSSPPAMAISSFVNLADAVNDVENQRNQSIFNRQGFHAQAWLPLAANFEEYWLRKGNHFNVEAYPVGKGVEVPQFTVCVYLFSLALCRARMTAKNIALITYFVSLSLYLIGQPLAFCLALETIDCYSCVLGSVV